MSYSERTLTAELSKFLRKNPRANEVRFSFVCELKVKKGKQKLNLTKDFQPHQIPNLIKVVTGCLYHKISDMGTGFKPFDCFNICNTPAFVGVLWYTPRKPRFLYLLDVRDIDFMMKNKVKSISKEDAEKNCIFKLDLKTA